MKLSLSILLCFSLMGCGKQAQQLASLGGADTANFEIREVSTTEEKHAATDYSKEWNEFKTTGTIVAEGVPTDRAVVVTLELRDLSDGPDPESKITSILIRRGTGKLEVGKSNYNEMSKRPNYQFSVLGWQPFNNGTATVIR